MGTARRQYMDEFKREAVGLLVSSGRPLSEIAQELGIAPSRLRKMVEDRLGKTRSAVVTAIRICFIISRCPPELLLGGTKIYDGPLHGSPHGKGLTLPRSIESGNLRHNEAVIRLMPTMGDFLSTILGALE